MFESNKYTIRRKVISFLGATFEVYDSEGNVVLYAKQKAFKLKEELRLYTASDMKEEVLTIKARNMFDMSATYDIKDSKSDQVIGAVRRKGIHSILRDEWTVLDTKDGEIGTMVEDSMGLALLRRFVMNLIPQNYDYFIAGEKVADLKQQFNPFVYKLDVDFVSEGVDKRVVLASAVILSLVEGRQE